MTARGRQVIRASGTFSGVSNLSLNLDLPDLLVGWVRAAGVTVEASPPELTARLDDLVGDPGSYGLDDGVRAGVRDLLRGHGYKPSGRGKPASEFLVGAATRGEFPHVNNLVDINNLVSLETGWPISIIDIDRAGTDTFELRHGHAGERYAFNNAGHEIDLAGLLCLARPDGEAFGNPVKDPMATRLGPETARVLAVMYTSHRVTNLDAVEAAARRFGRLIARHAGACEVDCGALAAPSLTP